MKSVILSAVISMTIGLGFQAQAQQAQVVKKIVISKIAQNAEAKALLGLSAEATEAQIASALKAISNATVRAQVVKAMNSYAVSDNGKLSVQEQTDLARKVFGRFKTSQPFNVSLSKTSRLGLSTSVTEAAASENAQMSEVSAARINDFSQRLMAGILEKTEPGKNVFITGPAMAGAMAMLVNGASKKGQKEILEALGYKADELGQLNADVSALMAQMNTKSNSIETSMSNAFFADVGLPVRSEYAAVVEQKFGAVSKQVEFQNNPEAAANTINTWASESTQGMVKSIVDAETAAGLASMLATAIYFKGNWETQFNPEETGDREFFVNNDFDQLKDVPTMKGTMDLKGIVNYQTGISIAQLPYAGGAASMYVIMPTQDSGLTVDQALAQAMGSKDIEKFSNGNNEVRIFKNEEVQLPKFRLAYSNGELKSVFEAMGVDAVFKSRNLMGLSPDERLFVAYIKMDTALEVDEKGTKAAGVASIGMVLESAVAKPFVFNRPFAIVIRDERNGVNLFTGVINDPSVTE